MGYTVKRIGQNHTLKEMDSIRIHNRTNWFRWSEKIGGSQIDFLIKICNIPFTLPPTAEDNRLLYKYLHEQRGLGIAIIDYFLNRKLIYQSKPHNNIVFVGMDASGIPRFAHMRGTNSPFKCDVAGSDKNYGFNIPNSQSDHLNIFESGIDLMSYTELFEDYFTNKLALGMLGDAPIDTFLNENQQIVSLNLCLDADEPGRKAAGNIRNKYEDLGYMVTDSTTEISYKDYKDFNEWLMVIKSGPFAAMR